jgi:hypothetical protein
MKTKTEKRDPFCPRNFFAAAANSLTALCKASKDEVRRIAANVAKLPKVLRSQSDLGLVVEQLIFISRSLVRDPSRVHQFTANGSFPAALWFDHSKIDVSGGVNFRR